MSRVSCLGFPPFVRPSLRILDEFREDGVGFDVNASWELQGDSFGVLSLQSRSGGEIADEALRWKATTNRGTGHDEGARVRVP